MKKGIVKKIFGFLGIAMVATFGSYRLVNALEKHDVIDVGGGIYVGQLSTPQNVSIEDNVLSWNKVYNGKEYVIKIDNNVYKTTEASYDLSFLTPDTYEIKVKATGDNIRDSEWSEEITHTIYTPEEQIQVENDFIQSKILSVYLDKYPDVGFAKVIMFQNNGENIDAIIRHTYTDEYFAYKNVTIKLDNTSIDKSITPENMEIVNVTQYKRFENVNFSKAPNIGVLEELKKEGWSFKFLNNEFSFSHQDLEKQRYYAKYVCIVKCEKDGEVKYVYQESEAYLNDNLGDTYSMLKPAFENGELLEPTEVYVKVYDNLQYLYEGLKENTQVNNQEMAR